MEHCSIIKRFCFFFHTLFLSHVHWGWWLIYNLNQVNLCKKKTTKKKLASCQAWLDQPYTLYNHQVLVTNHEINIGGVSRDIAPKKIMIYVTWYSIKKFFKKLKNQGSSKFISFLYKIRKLQTLSSMKE